MPTTGDTNEKFGVYRSVCCGAEIVIVQGAMFPHCPKHPETPTKWKFNSDDQSLRESRDKKKAA